MRTPPDHPVNAHMYSGYVGWLAATAAATVAASLARGRIGAVQSAQRAASAKTIPRAHRSRARWLSTRGGRQDPPAGGVSGIVGPLIARREAGAGS